jgi:hypothetical protein
MPTAEKTEPGKDEGQAPLAAQKTRIRSQVAKQLGTPADLLKIRVHPVGSESFRVNVWVGKSYTTARVTDSFFLTADEDGNVMASTPKIVRLY